MTCTSRITKDDTRLLFGDASHWFYVEERCSYICNGPICSRCLTKTDTNVQSSRRFKHGCIGEAYPEKTHLFGSPWYLAKIKTYGEPSKESVEKAMQAQRKAQGSLALPILKKVEKSEKTEKKEKAEKTEKKEIHVEKKVKKARTNIIVEKEKEVPVKISLLNMTPKISESSDDPLPVRSVSILSFKPFHLQEVRYWKDNNGKVYECRDNKLGKCLGVWDEELQEIQDLEECV